MVVKIINSDPAHIKRFYMDSGVIFSIKCPSCSDILECRTDMFEYPAEGVSAYFGCEACEISIDREIKCIGGEVSYTLDVPDDITFNLN